MRVSAETAHLLEKRLRAAVQPLEIVACTFLATAVFITVYVCSVFRVRYDSAGLGQALIFLCVILATGVTLFAAMKWRSAKPFRSWLALGISTWLALIVARYLGNRYWYENMVTVYTLEKDMANYVNIDPATDKGQSFMDAGTIYFKEGSYVLKGKAIAFHNGLTYCVAPIVRAPVDWTPSSGAPETESHFVLPQSGTVDFWAVGTDCCGKDGNTFTCGDVDSHLSRSGLRLLDDTARSMYLLAVQEWSATTGLPVRHPIFFRWTKDPLMHLADVVNNAWQDFWLHVIGCFLIALFFSFALHAIMRKMNIS
mmetsp:Transcript_101650/g.270353  ORF Transcript_101650/g.270353 Transcript_101650/m.270353 type:complete len:311 (-) Transcript_101650:110-1042(-)